MAFLIAVASGGFLGSIGRAWIGRKVYAGSFPWATFTVNATGSFAFSCFVQIQSSIPPWLSLALITGFCGAFTTFSSLILETIILYRSRQLKLAIVYLVATILTSLSASACGLLLGSYLMTNL